MADHVIVDTGPLVSILRHDDQHHAACRTTAQNLRPPLITTWLVITEAAWLLRRVPGGVERLVELLESGLVRCHDLDAAFPAWLKGFLRQYADLRPQIADASLVYVAGNYQTETVFTLDRRDFQVFRNLDGKQFRLVPESL